MKTLKKNQSGFGLMPVVAVILVIVIVAMVGMLVVRRHNKKNLNAVTSSPTTPTKSDVSSNTPIEQQAQQYLTVKEWGVKIPLSDAISDAYYVVSVGSNGADGLPNKVFLGKTSLDSNGCQASGDNEGKDTAIAAILRVSPSDKDPVTGETTTTQYPNGITIGDYYYAFQELKNNNCKASASSIQSSDSAFSSAVKAASRAN